MRYLLADTSRSASDGRNLVDVIVTNITVSALASTDKFDQEFARLSNELRRDGFVVADGQLQRAIPGALPIPQNEDEVSTLLRYFGFDVALGHMEQAIQNHTVGNWASANAQLRSFVEALMDSIAERLQPDVSKLPPGGWARVVWLANRQPPFFLPQLNEWQNDSNTGRPIGFVYGIWQRLHPQGSHPGLSDEDDATFRLHVVLLLARLLLRRLKGFV
jgi:hypothetical protein